jgi:hypothetical protein
VGEAVLSAADLRRAVLVRQSLATRVDPGTATIAEVVSRCASLQTQYAPTAYVGLWSRIRDLRREDLTTALERRDVVQGTMMRSTIHVAAAADYWPLNLAIRDVRRAWYLRVRGAHEGDVLAAADRVRAALMATDHLGRQDLDALAGTESSYVGLFADLVRVPPAGTWERRRADLFALAERWVGPEPALPEETAMEHLVRHYLAGFGPATANEIASWAGMNVGAVAPVLQRLELTRHRAVDGKVLVDLPDLDIPTASTVLPPRFLGPWEALLLVHARRAEILAEDDRPRIFSTKTPQSFATFLVNGVVAGTWRYADGGIEVTPWRPLAPSARSAVDDEAAALAAWHA